MTIVTLTLDEQTNELFMVSDQMIGDSYRSITTIPKIFGNEIVTIGLTGDVYLVDRKLLLEMMDFEDITTYLKKISKYGSIAAIVAYGVDEIFIITHYGERQNIAHVSAPGTSLYIGDLSWLLSAHRDDQARRMKTFFEHQHTCNIIRKVQALACGHDDGRSPISIVRLGTIA